MDRVEMEWHHGLLGVLGVSPRSLPPLCDADELHERGLAEEMQERWPELANTLWSRGIGDGAAANVGSRSVSLPRLACASHRTHSLAFVAVTRTRLRLLLSHALACFGSKLACALACVQQW